MTKGTARNLVTIDKPEAIEAMARSGYLLEGRVSALLRSRGWFVESNSAYLDSDTGRRREIDVHAVDGSSIFDDHRGNSFVFHHLLIECVNSPQPLVFVKSDSLLDERKAELVKEASDPVLVREGSHWQSVPTYFRFQEFHHVIKAPLATQYFSFTKKDKGKGEWMAMHDEVQHGSFVALGQVTEYQMGNATVGPIERMVNRTHIPPPHVELFYPVLVVQNEIWEIDQSEGPPDPTSVDRINYKHTNFRNGTFGEYIVTVVSEKGLPTFIAEVESEGREIARRAAEKIEFVVDSQKHISEIAGGAKPPKVIRSPHIARIIGANIVTREREKELAGKKGSES
jgi:hypothetical protein